MGLVRGESHPDPFAAQCVYAEWDSLGDPCAHCIGNAKFTGIGSARRPPGFQGFISPESFSLMESVMIVAMVVLGGLGYLPGVILGAILLSALPEVLRYVAGPLQEMTGGRLDAAILRQLLVALAMIVIMLMRPRGLWPSPEHGQSLKTK